MIKMDAKDKKEENKICSYSELFIFADKQDKILITIGTISAFLNGLVFPSFTIIFGNMAQSFSPSNSGDETLQLASKYCLYFFLVGLATLLLSFLMFSTWMISATRQSIKLRIKYFEALLN